VVVYISPRVSHIITSQKCWHSAQIKFCWRHTKYSCFTVDRELWSWLIVAFRCCYCYHMNEARRLRLPAPSLDKHQATSVSDARPTTEHGSSAHGELVLVYTHTEPPFNGPLSGTTQGEPVPVETFTNSHPWGRRGRIRADHTVHCTELIILLCDLAVLDPRVGHTTDVLFPFISVLCHSDWLFRGEFWYYSWLFYLTDIFSHLAFSVLNMKNSMWPINVYWWNTGPLQLGKFRSISLGLFFHRWEIIRCGSRCELMRWPDVATNMHNIGASCLLCTCHAFGKPGHLFAVS